MARTKIETKQVIVEEFYQEESGKIYFYWKREEEMGWHKILTPYKRLPVIKIDFKPKDKKFFKFRKKHAN
jgi:hypothetical protein